MPQMVFFFFQSLRGLTEEQEQCCIAETAAKITKNATKELDSNNNSYPTPDGLESSGKNVEYFSKSLLIVLDNSFLGKEKSLPLALIGQAIIH